MRRSIVAAVVPYFMVALYRQRGGIAATVPLVIRNGRVVTACCPLAAKSGVQPKMTLRQAQSLAPNARHLMVDEAFERVAIDRLLTRLAEFTPLIEYGISETIPFKSRKRSIERPYPEQAAVFYLDLESLNQSDAERLGVQLQSTLRDSLETPVQIGLGTGKFPAYCTALYGLEIARESLPIDLLPLDEALAYRLHLLGLTTLGTFGALPVTAIYRQFGKTGVFLYQLAHGYDPRRVKPFEPEVIERVSQTMNDPVHNLAAFEAYLQLLCETLSARLQMKGCMGRTLELAITLENGRRYHRSITLQREVAGVTHIERALRTLSEALIPRVTQGICEITLTLTDIVPFAGFQLDLFDHNALIWQQLTRTVEKLAVRYGSQTFSRVVPNQPNARLIERRYQTQLFIQP